MIPAARFIRVSGDTQDEESQVQDCDRAAQREGLEFVMPDFRLHAVSGSKGVKKHLDALEQALEAVRSGQIQAIVVAHSSRLTRLDPDDAMIYSIAVRKAGGRVYSHDEPHFGSPDKLGRLLSMLAADDNHEYSQTLSGHICRKFRAMDADGAFRGQPPAGYEVTGEKWSKKLVPAAGRRQAERTRKGQRVMITLPSAADIREAFRDAAAGTATPALGRRLGMTSDAVAKLLRSPVYSTGIYSVKRKDGVTVIHKCEPLVHPGLQEAAIAGLAARRRGDNVSSRAIVKEDFSTALRCGHCGGRTHRYYGGGRKRKDGTPGAKVRRYVCESCMRSVNADAADAAVHQLMSTSGHWWARMVYVPGDDSSAALARVNLELRELPGRGLEEDAEDAERARLRAERRHLEALPSTPARMEMQVARREDGSVISEGEHWAQMSMTERRAYLLGMGGMGGWLRITAAPGRKGLALVEREWAEAA